MLIDVALDEKLSRSVRNIPGVSLVRERAASPRATSIERAAASSRRRARSRSCRRRWREQIMKLTDVIRRPLITEKTSILREDGRTLVFQVAPSANKVEIKRAVEKLLGVEGRQRPHEHRARQDQAAGPLRRPRSDWKKAYVKLREGEKMPEFLEGA